MPKCAGQPTCMGLQQLQDEVMDWIRRVHPKRTPQGTLIKLFEEIGEIASCPDDPSEYADVFIVLMDLACQNGIDAGTLLLHAHRKMETNRNRNWKIASTGVMNHE